MNVGEQHFFSLQIFIKEIYAHLLEQIIEATIFTDMVDSEIVGIRNPQFSATKYTRILPSIPHSRDGYVGYLLNTQRWERIGKSAHHSANLPGVRNAGFRFRI